MQKESTDIANYLEKQAHYHGSQERPCLVADAEPALEAKQHHKAQHVNRVADEAGPICNDLPRYWALANMAVFPLHGD